MNDIEEALPTFIAESRSLLEEMEAALLRLEGAPADSDAINAVFRAAHTIKGSAGLFGLDEIVAFTHRAETVLDKTREGLIAVNSELTDLFLECCDHITGLINFLAEGRETDSDIHEHDAALSSRLDVYLGMVGLARTSVAVADAVVSSDGSPLKGDTWHISLRFGTGVLRDGMDPLSFLRYLAGMGEIVHITTLVDAMPPVMDMNPECCYLDSRFASRRMRTRRASRASSISFDTIARFVLSRREAR